MSISFPYKDLKPATTIKSTPEALGEFCDIPHEILEIIFKNLVDTNQLYTSDNIHNHRRVLGLSSGVCRSFNILSVSSLNRLRFLTFDNNINHDPIVQIVGGGDWPPKIKDLEFFELDEDRVSKESVLKDYFLKEKFQKEKFQNEYLNLSNINRKCFKINEDQIEKFFNRDYLKTLESSKLSLTRPVEDADENQADEPASLSEGVTNMVKAILNLFRS